MATLQELDQKLQEKITDIKRKQAEKKLRDSIPEIVSNSVKGSMEDYSNSLLPSLQELVDNASLTKEELIKAIKAIKIEVPEPPPVNIPEIKAPKVEVPKAEVNVKIPDIKTEGIEQVIEKAFKRLKLPKIEVPESKVEIPNGMEVALKGINYKSPMPVIQIGLDGKPYIPSFPISGGGRGAMKKSHTSGRYGAVTIATTATLISGEGERQLLSVVHENSDSIYLGFNNGVTTSNGFPIVANQAAWLEEYSGSLYAIISNGAASSTISLRYFEI